MGFKDTRWAYTLELTAAECAVLVAICFKTDDRTHTTYASQQTLAELSKLTRPTVNKILGVLETNGYITRVKRNDSSGQRLASIIIANVNVANVGQTNVGDANVGETESQCQPDAEPMSASPTAIGINQIDQPDSQPVTPAIDLEALFNEAWKQWPNKGDRKDALKKFLIVTRKQEPIALAATIAAHGQAHALHTEKQFVPMLVTWLNKERWNNPLPTAPSQSRNNGKPTPTERALGIMSLVPQLQQKAVNS